MVRDMTKDQPWKVILFFFIPLYIGNMFQQVYTTVDSMIVGRFVGVDAFAGIFELAGRLEQQGATGGVRHHA